MKGFKSYILLALALCVTRALAQPADCPAIVERALATVDAACQETGRNQACYGNIALTAEPQPGVEQFRFEQVGDTVNVADVQSLRLSPLDVDNGAWGVALLKLQANLPDTLPGQNVTMLLFGDVELENRTAPDDETYTPMQAFYFRSGVGDAPCAQAPDSGLLVQTPQGVGEVAFNVNGVDVRMGSTVFFQAADETEMQVATLEGAAYLQKDGQRQVILAGTQARVPLLEILAAPSGATAGTGAGSDTPPPPLLGEPYNADRFKQLPLGLLERPIEIHPPLTDDQLARARELLESGHAPCGEEPFPPCHELPSVAGGSPCLLPPGPNDPPLPPHETRPLCDVQPEAPREDRPDDNRPCVFQPRPGDPPLPPDETRPFCPTPEPPPTDDRPCVFQPRPGDPPLPPDETRPFCPTPEPPPDASG